MSRIARRFAELRGQGRAGFVAFITAGDPDAEVSFAILAKLPDAGVDIVELGMPFSDPMADGPVIQASSLRALDSGMTVKKTLDLVRRFRARDDNTPVVLMGYFNPIHSYGLANFVTDASISGVDGLIVVDLSPEEDVPLRSLARDAGVDIIRLAAPTTDDLRLDSVLDGASGFLYYISFAGVTGTKNVAEDHVRAVMTRIKRRTDLPCAVGFGIRTPEQAAAVARVADAVVVGSAIVSRIGEARQMGKAPEAIAGEALSYCREMANAVRNARAAGTA